MEGNMEELKVVNGETYSRDVEIKIVPCCLQAAQDRSKKNNEVKRIVARRKAIRKNRLLKLTFGCAVLASILCILSLETSFIYLIPLAVFGAYSILFYHVNQEALS